MVTPGRIVETRWSSFRICWESASILAFCRSIFLLNASSVTASAFSSEGVCAELVKVIAPNRREKQQKAKRIMSVTLAERELGGKSARWAATPLTKAHPAGIGSVETPGDI